MMVDRSALLLSRAWFAADILAGMSRGSRCPNCGACPDADARIRWGTLHAFAVWDCQKCRLLYRPAGLIGGALTRFYYSRIYSNANLATDAEAIAHLEGLQAAMGDRRRAHLLRELVGLPSNRPPVVYVLGCSWGYEVWDLQQSGLRAVGIEISDPRRELGRRTLGLPLYASVREARAREPHPDIVLSSHVLEHIPRLDAYLDDLLEVVQPTYQIHITPNVECYRTDPASQRLVGREHPIGVTRAFWRRFADRHRFDLTDRVDGYRPGEWAGELVAVLKKESRTA